MNTTIFKAYDVRGKVGSELDEETAKQIGKAFAAWLPTPGQVAVGRDMRPDSAELAKALIQGLTELGRDVLDIGQVTSDMVYFAVGSRHLAGGMVVTASHNPGEYNGIKFCREEAMGVSIETGLASIRDMAFDNDFVPADVPGQVTEANLVEDWVKHALSHATPQTWPAYNVVVDAGNGMAGLTFPVLQKYVPLKVTPLYFELDGTFPNHIANPLEAKNLVDAQKKMQEVTADFGIAFDGDGDRAVLIDEKGLPLSGTVTTALLARYFLKKNPGATVLYNAICGRAVPEVIKESGGIGHRTKVGHSFIKEDMRTYNAVFAGEHSGHYYFNFNFNADSGLIAAVTIIQILAESGKKLSELADELRTRYLSIPETNFTISDPQTVFIKARDEFADGEIDELDGLTVNYPTKWINIRPSNTEPLVRLNAEAKTQQELDDLLVRAKSIIES